MRCQAAVQFEWQSSRVPMIPPFKIPGKASWCGWGDQSQTTSSPSGVGKLRIRSPFSLAGPQPKQLFFGA